MSAISAALVKLEQSIAKLESAAASVETKIAEAGQQQDMFGGAPATMNAADKQMVVQKLDEIIQQAEGVLKEASA